MRCHVSDWVFKAVAYPIRYSLIIDIFRDYMKTLEKPS
ncbi:hypothetical protein CWATWH0402_6405 [Crocosphaera watsonii WH 0402]|uniref:Uncharacterized protein n=1 Tax=Crocosphaera watsonii WH 0402 TaxID=1284629 RepID=T2JLW6_CROWT|nr:hypothetical protein CWATWH0402_6405 [Crocosphaera watsonii WH 0402]